MGVLEDLKARRASEQSRWAQRLSKEAAHTPIREEARRECDYNYSSIIIIGIILAIIVFTGGTLLLDGYQLRYNVYQAERHIDNRDAFSKLILMKNAGVDKMVKSSSQSIFLGAILWVGAGVSLAYCLRKRNG